MGPVIFEGGNMKHLTFCWCAVAAGLACLPAQAMALQANLVGSGLNRPLFLTTAAGDSRLFVAEQGGMIKTLQNGVASTYLDLSGLVDSSGERGLLGLAFDPNFLSNQRFYVDYIDKTTLNTVVASYTAPGVNAASADPNSGHTLLTVEQPAGQNNHKAGWLGFRNGEPGNLYIATGDGGSANDPDNRAQNLNDNLGKILRITPNASGSGYTIPDDNPFAGSTPGNDEIWAYGLRNPFRNSFDPQTGNFWIADVGQDTREEINLQPAGTPGGRNYGWRALEGDGDNPAVPAAPPANATAPLFSFTHASGLGGSIIGGYVYRGAANPSLQGAYIFGDFVTGRIFALRQQNGSVTSFDELTSALGTPFGAFQLTSFGEDGAGELYMMGLNGNVYHIAAAAVPEPGEWAMLIAGLGVVSLAARRRQRQR